MEKKEALTTIFIPRGLICDHRFQALIDKNFLVEGYQIEELNEID